MFVLAALPPVDCPNGAVAVGVVVLAPKRELPAGLPNNEVDIGADLFFLIFGV